MRDPKEFRERFLRWKNGENYWEQRGINMNTQQSLDLQADLLTPEQLTAIEAALEYYTSGKDAVDDVPPERVGIFDPETTHILSFETGNLVPKRGYIVDNTGTIYAVDNRGLQYNSVLPEVEVVGDRSKFSQKLANLDLQNVLPADNVFVQNNLNSKTPNPELIYLNRYKGVDGMSGLENGIFEGIQWTPFVGDAIDLLLGASDLVDGNYLSAGLTGGLLFVPYGNKFRKLGNTIGDIKNILKLDVPISSKWQRFKNLDQFDKLRGIKFKTDIYHGSFYPFNIREAQNYNATKNDTGIHFGETLDPTYSRANPIYGGAVYKGQLKLKDKPIRVDDLGTWTPYTLMREAVENRRFRDQLLMRGVTINDLLELDNGYMKGFADYMKDHGVVLLYKNKFETVKDVPDEFSYVVWDKNLPVWEQFHKYLKDERTIDKLKELGLYRGNVLEVMKDFPIYQNPDNWVDFNRGKDKGIHINPKNRGKFNALKKRTGKTTEQLTHSKNPLTRKRAIFAQNAKKWKKK